MEDIVAPLVAQLLENELQYLEVVVLLVTYDIDDAIQSVLLEALQCSAKILCHIYRCAIATEQQLLVKAISLEVDPNRSILLAEEYALCQTVLDESLAKDVGLRLVVYLVEINAESLVCYVESVVNPAIHLLPKCTHLGILCLPLAEHLLCLEKDWSLLLGILFAHSSLDELLDFGLVVLVELHIVVAYKVVTFLACRLRCSTVAVAQPRNHRLADVDTTVVHKVSLDYIVTISSQNLRNRVTEEVVADVSEVEWLVGVRRRVLDHNGATCRRCYAVVLVCRQLTKTLCPECWVEREIQEALDYIERAELRSRSNDLLANLGSYRLRCFASHLNEWENHESVVALELLASLLNLNLRVGNLTIESLYSRLHYAANVLFYIHFCLLFFQFL